MPTSGWGFGFTDCSLRDHSHKLQTTVQMQPGRVQWNGKEWNVLVKNILSKYANNDVNVWPTHCECTIVTVTFRTQFSRG